MPKLKAKVKLKKIEAQGLNDNIGVGFLVRTNFYENEHDLFYFGRFQS